MTRPKPTSDFAREIMLRRYKALAGALANAVQAAVDVEGTRYNDWRDWTDPGAARAEHGVRMYRLIAMLDEIDGIIRALENP